MAIAIKGGIYLERPGIVTEGASSTPRSELAGGALQI